MKSWIAAAVTLSVGIASPVMAATSSATAAMTTRLDLLDLDPSLTVNAAAVDPVLELLLEGSGFATGEITGVASGTVFMGSASMQAGSSSPPTSLHQAAGSYFGNIFTIINPTSSLMTFQISMAGTTSGFAESAGLAGANGNSLWSYTFSCPACTTPFQAAYGSGSVATIGQIFGLNDPSAMDDDTASFDFLFSLDPGAVLDISILYGANAGALAQAAIPEPASWAMMIAGFGLIGATLRRRRMVAV